MAINIRQWAVVVGLGWLAGCSPMAEVGVTPTAEVETGKPDIGMAETVRVVIESENGKREAEVKWQEGEKVLDVLKKWGEQAGVEVGVKEYDFGAMVTAIGEEENTKEKGWIYYVNGVVAEVGASEKTVEPEDVVEWKYQESIY